MSKYLVTFIENIEGRDSISHGGVLFPIGKAVELDSDKVAMSPWFEGNSSFRIEEKGDETSQNQRNDAAENAGDRGAGEVAGEDAEKLEVKPAKRTRKKVAQS